MFAQPLLVALSKPLRLLRSLGARACLPLALGGALCTFAAPAAAQELSFHIGKRLGDAEVGLTLSTGHRHATYGHRYGRRSRGHVSAGKVWIAGRYETVERRVWIPARRERIWVDPAYRTVYDSCGRASRVLVRSGRWEWVHRPGHYEVRHVNVWKPGYWSTGSSGRIVSYGRR